jgi:signal transduction histidine kinase
VDAREQSARGPALLPAAVLVALAAGAGAALAANGQAVGAPGFLVAAVVVVVAGTATAAWLGRDDRRAGPGLALAAAGALLPVWSSAPMVPRQLAAALLAAPPLVVAGAAHLLPPGRAPRLVPLAVIAAVAVHVAGYDPFQDPGCTARCGVVVPPAGEVLGTRAAVTAAAVLTGVAALLVLVRAARAPRSQRALAATVAVAVVLLSTTGILRAVRWEEPLPTQVRLLSPLLATSVLCLGVVVLALRRRRTHRQLGELVRRLEAGTGPTVLGDVVAVHYALPDGAGWVDGEGLPVPQRAPPGAVDLPPDAPILRILPRADADLAAAVDRLTAADVMVLSNARLAAVTRAHQREVRASQRRIVALSDGERQRVERDLHDGTQQRLVSAKLYLRVAAAELDAPGAVERAESSLQVALERLRRLSHGLYPRVLVDEGFEAALDELAATAGVPVAVAVAMDGAEPPQTTALASYALIAALVSRSAGGVDVRVRLSGGVLSVEVETPDDGPVLRHDALVAVVDRVGAAEGRLSETAQAGRRTVVAELPCES